MPQPKLSLCCAVSFEDHDQGRELVFSANLVLQKAARINTGRERESLLSLISKTLVSGIYLNRA
jgi:hypothetical protein